MKAHQAVRLGAWVLLASCLGACGRIDYDPVRNESMDASPIDGQVNADGGADGGSAHNDAHIDLEDAALGDGEVPIDTDAGGLDAGGIDAGPPAETLVVEATYPEYAAWNDYLLPTDTGEDLDHQPAVSCPSRDAIDGIRCVHGGERRRVATGRVSCGGLSLVDDLGAFAWRCDDRTGSAIFYSRGLLPGRGLADLVLPDGSGFRALGVTLLDAGVAVEVSPRTVWWSNQVKPVPPGAILRNDNPSIGDIYVVTTNLTLSGLTLAEDRLALVVLPGATLSFEATAPLNCASTAGGSFDARCLIFAEGVSFLWIEGSFQGVRAVATLQGLLLRELRSSRLQNIRIRDTGSHAIHLMSVFESRIEDIEQQNAGGDGVRLTLGSHNRFLRIRASRAGTAFSMTGSGGAAGMPHLGANNIVHDLVVSNSTVGFGAGCGTSTGVFTKIVAVANGSGVSNGCTQNHTLSHITSHMNSTYAIQLNRGSGETVVQAIASASDTGLRVWSGNGIFAQIVATDNSDYGVNVGSNANRFFGTLIVGNNTSGDCYVNSTYTNSGLVDGTCTASGTDGSSDYGTQPSTAILRTGRTLLNSFLGRVSVDDSVNISDMNGLGASVTDWLGFESRYRTWGLEGTTVVDLAIRGPCTGNCRIWDWRLSAMDTSIFGRARDGATRELPSPGAACPVSVRGDMAITDRARLEILSDGSGDDDGACEGAELCHPPNTFLINALEVMDDGIGDEDGLCESSETCIASPHIGAWQGDGEPTEMCAFDPGPMPMVTNVAMLVR